jgi:orotidine-5'-phosphate decarboxylase
VECKQPRGISDLDAAARALLAFGRGIIEAVAPHVPVLKINIAFFEPFRDAGIRTYYELVQIAHQAGMLVIGDIKRADIGHSTTQYAVAHLGGSGLDDSTVPDAVTVNPYFGLDAVKPFSDIARDTGRGLFVLVATSNESAAQVQGITLNDGRIVSDAVAELVESWASAEGMLGSSGYSCVGAVVSPRDLPATKRIRTLMPHCTFLVPGFGAQGRSADEVATCFRNDGAGAIVTASRTVIYAYEDAQRGTSETDWRVSVASTCRDFVNAVREVIPAC